MKIFISIILLLFLFTNILVYSKDINNNNNKISINNNHNNNNNNINKNNNNNLSSNKNTDNLNELTFTDFITQDLSNNVTRAKFEKQLRSIFPNITHQDVEMIKQVRQMNFTKVIKALTKDDLNDILVGIVAGVEKSINDSPGNCVEGLRKQITETNQVVYDLFNIYGITIGEFFNFLKIIPTVIKEDLQIYNTCGINKIVKKLSSCANVIIHQGFTVFLDNEKNVLAANLFNLLPITRGIASSLLIKNYQLLGVHLGEYLGIFINAPTESTSTTSTPESTTSSFISSFFGKN